MFQQKVKWIVFLINWPDKFLHLLWNVRISLGTTAWNFKHFSMFFSELTSDIPGHYQCWLPYNKAFYFEPKVQQHLRGGNILIMLINDLFLNKYFNKIYGHLFRVCWMVSLLHTETNNNPYLRLRITSVTGCVDTLVRWERNLFLARVTGGLE